MIWLSQQALLIFSFSFFPNQHVMLRWLIDHILFTPRKQKEEGERGRERARVRERERKRERKKHSEAVNLRS